MSEPSNGELLVHLLNIKDQMRDMDRRQTLAHSDLKTDLSKVSNTVSEHGTDIAVLKERAPGPSAKQVGAYGTVGGLIGGILAGLASTWGK